MPTDREIMDIFLGEICPACKRRKRTRNAFCQPCYKSLPQFLRGPLWKHFRAGFESAFRKALNHLRRNPRPQPQSDVLSFAQSQEENRKSFVARLVAAGWSEEAARKEWTRIQTEEPEGDFD